jgi:hypothetical protein
VAYHQVIVIVIVMQEAVHLVVVDQQIVESTFELVFHNVHVVADVFEDEITVLTKKNGVVVQQTVQLLINDAECVMQDNPFDVVIIRLQQKVVGFFYHNLQFMILIRHDSFQCFVRLDHLG